jgi:hypothetical protein
VLLWSFESAAFYDLCSDTWTLLEHPPMPPLTEYRALWAGSELLVWGSDAADNIVAHRLDPNGGGWRDEPEIDRVVTPVWTGTEILIPIHHAP